MSDATNPTQPILEGEIIDSTPSVANPADTTLAIGELINNYLNNIDHLKEQIAKFREMLESIFQSDPTYMANDAAVKEAQKVKNGTKKQILKSPQAADLNAKLADLRGQLKEYNQSLSDYLQQYAKDTGQTTLETPSGEVKQIIYIARLVKSQ